MKIVKNATGVIEIRNSTTNELEKFFDPTGMIVNDHPRAADCICVSKTPAEQDETESINIRISDVTHVGGVAFTGETRASLKEALVLLFKKGGGDGEGSQGVSTPEVWTRPTEWLAIPSYTVNEEVIYLLNAVWDSAVNPCAFQINGTGAGYTVDWGDGTVTNYAFGAQAERNYVYSSLSGTPFRGYRQALIKITPQAGAVINSVRLSNRCTGFGYTYHTGLLEIICNIETQNQVSPFTASSLVQHSNVENVFYKKHTSTNLEYLFSGFSSLQKVNAFPTSHCTSMTYMFSYCISLIEVPNFDFSNITNALGAFMGCIVLSEVKSSDFKKVTNAHQMFRDSYIRNLGNLQFRDATTFYLFNYPYGCLTNLPDFSLCNNITDDVSYTFYVAQLNVYPYINVASVPSLNNFFTAFPQRMLKRSLITGATRSHSYANQLLDAAALNEIFTNLGTAAGAQNITITGNPGVGTCNQSIATSKGWTVIN